MQLEGVEQALLLAYAQQERRATAADQLREWRMAPFLDAVLRQPRSFPLLRWSALLARHVSLSLPFPHLFGHSNVASVSVTLLHAGPLHAPSQTCLSVLCVPAVSGFWGACVFLS